MESVYLDLNLEQEYGHPDNRGWMNIFKHWSWSGMFRVTWAICASTYGARFQGFCRRHLGLDIREIEVGDPLTLPDGREERDKAWKAAEEQRVLNFLEIRLLEQFIGHEHNCVDSRDRVFPLQIAVCDPVGEGEPKRFTFGFALVRPDDPSQDRGGGAIRYFRIQDHLRQMGLARKALIQLIDAGYDRLDLGRMPSDASEALSPEELEQFKRLFNSARAEVQARQRKA